MGVHLIYHHLRSERRTKAAATLGIDTGASMEEVRKAHRKLMMELHPDRFAGDEEGAAHAQVSCCFLCNMISVVRDLCVPLTSDALIFFWILIASSRGAAGTLCCCIACLANHGCPVKCATGKLCRVVLVFASARSLISKE